MKASSRKVLSAFLALVMVVSMLSMSALAVGSTIQPGSGVNSITLSGAGAYSVDRTVEEFTSNSFTNYRYIYDIVLPSGVGDTDTITVTFDADSTETVSPVPPQGQPGQFIPIINANKTNTYSVTLDAGVGSTSAYVHHNLGTEYQHVDVYIFNFSKGTLNNPITSNGLTLRFGDPAYELTAPECYMSFDGSGSTYTVNYKGPYGDSSASDYSGYYPDILALSIDIPEETPITSISSVNNNMTLKVYDAASGELLESGQSLNQQKNAGFYTIELAYGSTAAYQLQVTTASGTTTLNFRAPKMQTVAAGSAPAAVVSYLPIGQYATGSSWGTSSGKFTGDNAYSSTGVSLGAFGGYIEFDFGAGAGITNNLNNPYGIDFVVYGNAFNGNPEAGAVQVSENGTTWYELAGSLYYDGGFAATGATQSSGKFSAAYTGTLRNADVTYTLNSDNITATMTGTGGSITATPFTTATAWWPETDEGYPMGTPHTDSNVTVSHSNSSLTFGGVTAVQDSNTTAFYAFGYADVTPNGSVSTYGDATNPYLDVSSKTGGDGFDLEWAVDISTGMPVDVTGKTFRYVRVYSAVLDNATFGETSTEVCGIFATANAASASVGRTAAPTITIDGTDVADLAGSISYAGNTVVYDTEGLLESGMEIAVSATSGSNVFLNSSAGDSYTVTAQTEYIRVIVQSGTTAPYIAIIK